MKFPFSSRDSASSEERNQNSKYRAGESASMKAIKNSRGIDIASVGTRTILHHAKVIEFLTGLQNSHNKQCASRR